MESQRSSEIAMIILASNGQIGLHGLNGLNGLHVLNRVQGELKENSANVCIKSMAMLTNPNAPVKPRLEKNATLKIANIGLHGQNGQNVQSLVEEDHDLRSEVAKFLGMSLNV